VRLEIQTINLKVISLNFYWRKLVKPECYTVNNTSATHCITCELAYILSETPWNVNLFSLFSKTGKSFSYLYHIDAHFRSSCNLCDRNKCSIHFFSGQVYPESSLNYKEGSCLSSHFLSESSKSPKTLVSVKLHRTLLSLHWVLQHNPLIWKCLKYILKIKINSVSQLFILWCNSSSYLEKWIFIGSNWLIYQNNNGCIALLHYKGFYVCITAIYFFSHEQHILRKVTKVLLMFTPVSCSLIATFIRLVFENLQHSCLLKSRCLYDKTSINIYCSTYPDRSEKKKINFDKQMRQHSFMKAGRIRCIDVACCHLRIWSSRCEKNVRQQQMIIHCCSTSGSAGSPCALWNQ